MVVQAEARSPRALPLRRLTNADLKAGTSNLNNCGVVYAELIIFNVNLKYNAIYLYLLAFKALTKRTVLR